MNKDNILKGLNKNQREAVGHIDGPVLIVAGAGSGKTRVLTHRLAYLVASGIKPENILMVTFTNKAATEMKARAEEILKKNNLEIDGGFQKKAYIGTFHKLGAVILREIAPVFKRDKNFVIFDQNDSKQIIKKCLKELDLSKEQYNPNTISDEISRTKNKMIDPEEYLEEATNIFQEKVAKIYNFYEKQLIENNAFDFDDLIVRTAMIFMKDKDILEKFQNRWQYLMVDEFQDTNPSQYAIIKMLAKKSRNICVVGDDDQAIYSWRQADVRNFLDFEKDWVNTKTILLGENYRTTKNILAAAGSLIEKNTFRKEKKLFTNNSQGGLIYLVKASNDLAEADFVVENIIFLMKARGWSFDDFAVLYRTNAQSRVVEEVMLKNGLPYRIFAGARFYDRREIRDLTAYLRLIANKNDKASLERVINVPTRGIGDKKKEIIFSGGSAFDKLSEIKESKNFVGAIMAGDQLAKNGAMISELINLVIELVEYKQFLFLDKNNVGQERWQNVLEFLRLAEETGLKGKDGLGEFLEKIALFQDGDDKQDKNGAQLMTLHSAKGLEFKVVFIIGVEEGLLPHSQSQFSSDDLEEERRLAYVGMTRAKEELFLIFSERRRIFGGLTSNPPSRFLGEIDSNLFENLSQEGYNEGNFKNTHKEAYIEYDEDGIEVEDIE